MDIWVWILVLCGLALIDGKLWKILIDQGRHHKAVEKLLAEIRDRSKPGA